MPLHDATLLCLLTAGLIAAHSISLDSNYPNRNVKRIAFGSCSNHRFPLDYLQNIIDTQPDVFLWTGDTVYGKTAHGTDLTNIRNNYHKLKSHPLYQTLLSSNLIVEGVYDDHDVGMNDADIRLSPSMQREAQQLLLDFLDLNEADVRRQRHGVYSVHKIDDIMIIMLDTRTHRSPTVIPSVGKWEYPFTAFIASYLRYLTAFFGFVDEYNGSVLGEEQWKWLQQILQSNEFRTSNLVLIVSSTQVFTSNPYFESWGHFPMEKKRLLELLSGAIESNTIRKHQHLLFISGDVHHAELIYGNAEYGPLEVTSSGLTHALGTMPGLFGLASYLSTHIADTYASYHRTKLKEADMRNAHYGTNFGMVEIVDHGQYVLKVYDAATGENVIAVPLNMHKKSSFWQVLSEMNDVYEDTLVFPRKYPFYGLEFIGPIIAILVAMYAVRYVYNRVTVKATKQTKAHKQA